jgi:hypothetical protein
VVYGASHRAGQLGENGPPRSSGCRRPLVGAGCRNIQLLKTDLESIGPCSAYGGHGRGLFFAIFVQNLLDRQNRRELEKTDPLPLWTVLIPD